MTSSLLAIRSIAAEFAFRIYWPVLIVLVIVAVLIIGLVIWLLMMSAWWWLLAVPVFLLILVGALVFFISFVILKLITPAQNKQQRELVKKFVDKIQRLSEITQTPKIVLLFRAIRDAVAPKKHGFVQSVIGDASSLSKDYKEIVEAFSLSD